MLGLLSYRSQSRCLTDQPYLVSSDGACLGEAFVEGNPVEHVHPRHCLLEVVSQVRLQSTNLWTIILAPCKRKQACMTVVA